MTTQEMMKATAKPGYWFYNVANVDETPDWREQVKPPETNDLIFGYTPTALLAKQYK